MYNIYQFEKEVQKLKKIQKIFPQEHESRDSNSKRSKTAQDRRSNANYKGKHAELVRFNHLTEGVIVS